MSPFYLFVPAGFEPAATLPSSLRRQGDVARYFLHRIVCGMVARRADENGFVPLKADTLRPYFPSRDIYKSVRDAMIENGVIISDNHYIKGEKAIGYKFGPEWIKMRHRKIPVTNAILARKLQARHDRKSMVVQTGVPATCNDA